MKGSKWQSARTDKILLSGQIQSEAHLGPCQIYNMERSCENNERLKAVNIFVSKHHHRCLTGF